MTAFSIFFFSSDSEENAGHKYGSLLEIAQFADERGFAAIWTPERHFHRFGGLFPNPSVLSAAIAVKTERIRIRAGSISLPFHHPIRVAEDWSVVDNLSNGRVDISVTYGWHPKEYVLAPDHFEIRKEIMFERIDILQRLWRGEPVTFPSGDTEHVIDQIYPEPKQRKLDIWVTTARTKETWRKAGEIGANILTALYAIDIATLQENIAIYRSERRKFGHASDGVVTLMLHTFMGEDVQRVRETVREPMIQYLMRHTEMYDAEMIRKALGISPEQITDAHRRLLASMAFERYWKECALFGSPESCARTVDAMASIGVNEIACLVDFGLRHADILESLEQVDRLRRRYGS